MKKHFTLWGIYLFIGGCGLFCASSTHTLIKGGVDDWENWVNVVGNYAFFAGSWLFLAGYYYDDGDDDATNNVNNTLVGGGVYPQRVRLPSLQSLDESI